MVSGRITFANSRGRRVPDARPDLLAEAIERDIADGKRPCCIVASVGSTSTSAVDPIPEIADVAERHDIWLHIDAAYGGSAATIPEMRHIFSGVHRAHSLVFNPHKWLYVSIDCSVLYTRRPEIFRRASSIAAEVIRTPEDERVVNFNEYGVQLGRRFRSLKLWYVFATTDGRASSRCCEESIRLAQVLKCCIEADADFEIAAPVPFSLVCFRHRGGNTLNKRLLIEINNSGKAFLSHTVLNGQYVLRFAIGNFQTTERDIRETWTLIQKIGKEIAAADLGLRRNEWLKQIALSITLCGVRLSNPVIAASGISATASSSRSFSISTVWAGLSQGSFASNRSPGNPSPRLWHTEGGMMNSVGLQNVGVRAFVQDKLPSSAGFRFRSSLNVFGYAPEDYMEVVKILEDTEGIAGYELNVSCPNTKHGGIFFLKSRALSDLIGRVRPLVKRRPLIVKLSPTLPAYEPWLESSGGRRGRSFTDQHRCFIRADSRTRPCARIAAGFGGFSGPAIKPLALRLVRKPPRSSQYQ